MWSSRKRITGQPNNQTEKRKEKKTMRKSLPIFIFAILAASASLAAMPDAAPTADAPAGVVNINTANAQELSLLPRVGEKVAQRIIDYRNEHGKFAKTSDLMQ